MWKRQENRQGIQQPTGYRNHACVRYADLQKDWGLVASYAFLPEKCLSPRPPSSETALYAIDTESAVTGSQTLWHSSCHTHVVRFKLPANATHSIYGVGSSPKVREGRRKSLQQYVKKRSGAHSFSKYNTTNQIEPSRFYYQVPLPSVKDSTAGKKLSPHRYIDIQLSH